MKLGKDIYKNDNKIKFCFAFFIDNCGKHNDKGQGQTKSNIMAQSK